MIDFSTMLVRLVQDRSRRFGMATAGIACALSLTLCAPSHLMSSSLAIEPDGAGVTYGPYVETLWLAHRYAPPASLRPEVDQHLKAQVGRSLTTTGPGKTRVLAIAPARNVFPADLLEHWAADQPTLTLERLSELQNESLPVSRTWLLPTVARHADLLSTGFDQISAVHHSGIAELVEWLVANYQSGRPLPVKIICTGNSRRSMLGATMGNVAACYYGLPEVQFYSGGTKPSAFNSRTIRALREIGVEIDPTGDEAERGSPDTANPRYNVTWAKPSDTSANAQYGHLQEFSKHYADASAPPDGFAAILVCDEADAGCPTVKGASVRIPMPFHDPKAFDDSPIEAAKYAERRDDIGRVMLSTLMQVRRRVADANK